MLGARLLAAGTGLLAALGALAGTISKSNAEPIAIANPIAIIHPITHPISGSTSVPRRKPWSTEPVTFVGPEEALVVGYPPLEPSAAPASAVIMLHGACSSAHDTCATLNDAARRSTWLVCPEGNAPCGPGYRDWTAGPIERAAFLDAILAELGRREPDRFAARAEHVLIGFSRGAFVARDLAYVQPGRYRALMLAGAATLLDRRQLEASGVRRVVMASADHDGARPTMRLAANVLAYRGFAARFVGLGPIYHWLPADFGAHVERALPFLLEMPNT
jgi:pimeloyl-ACP methyl ester carboxylesterase